MAIFPKNPNEVNYVGGKKHWLDVLKNRAEPGVILFRQPEEDFNNNSQLIVMPDEEAVFIKDGNIEQIFDSGKYKLDTENYPFLTRLRTAFSGGISSYNCVVYFVRKEPTLELTWGINEPIKVRDKVHDVAGTFTGYGAYKVAVENASVFMKRFMGQISRSLDPQQLLDDAFTSEFRSEIRSCVRDAVSRMEGELINLEDNLRDVTAAASEYIGNALQAFGVKLVRFSIEALVLDDDFFKQLQGIDFDAKAQIKAAQAKQKEIETLGGNWGAVQQVDIMKTMAANEGGGGIATTGAGLGMGIAAGGALGGMAGQVFQPLMTQQAVAPVADDPVATLKKLKDMLDMGLIEQAEFDAKKSEIMSRM